PNIWRQIATVADQQPRNDAIERQYRQVRRQIVHDVNAASAEARPSAVFLWQVNPGLFRLAAGQHSAAIDLALLGAINGSRESALSGNGQNVEIDTERLLELDPDVIFLSCCAGIRLDPSDLFERPQFASLSAVRTRRVYKEPVGGNRMEGLVEDPLLMRWM